MFTIRGMFEPQARGVIGTLTVTTTTMSEFELGAFVADLTDQALKIPNVEAVGQMVDHQTGKVCLMTPQAWSHVRSLIITKMDPSTEHIPFPLPDYIEGRVDALGHSNSHLYLEVSLNYRGIWTKSQPTVAWTN